MSEIKAPAAGSLQRVAMYYANADVRLQELPVPAIGPGEVLVRVDACGLCGSDVMEWYRKDKVPLVLGHEIAGTIVELAAGVEGWAVGDRVVVAHHVPCDECRYCRADAHTVCDTLRSTNVEPGGFAEYIRVPAINVQKGLFRIPEGTPADAASVAEALGCVLRGQRIIGVDDGMTVLVMGAGISGCLHILMAQANGANRVIATEVSEYRKGMAGRLGAESVIDGRADVAAELRQLNEGRGADIVIVTVGSPQVMADAIQCVDRNAGLLVFTTPERGVPVPFAPFDIFWRNEVRMISTYGAAPCDYDLGLRLIAGGTIDAGSLITHRLSLAEAGEGFRLVAGADESMKVIIEPGR